MRRSAALTVVDRRLVLRGMAAMLAASLTGCRLSLDHADPTADEAGPDAALPPPGVDAPGPGFVDCGGQLCLDLSAPANAALLAVDGARVITFNGKPLLVVRTSETTFAALSAVCTHAGCTVRYAAAAHDVACPCHGSTFALDGKVTRGPATLPLSQFATTFDAASQSLTIAT
jgi:cytochrome b6-f complex iron-sulfur subunit